jgi:hypothetical protein
VAGGCANATARRAGARGGRGPHRCGEVKFRGPLCSSAKCGNSTLGGRAIFGFHEGFSTNRQRAGLPIVGRLAVGRVRVCARASRESGPRIWVVLA